MKRVAMKLTTEQEVEVAEILLSLPKLCRKSELVSRYTFTWARKKKRSVLDSISEASSSPSPEKADKSPSTPLCFLPSGSGSDGSKPPSSATKVLKRKAKDDDLMEICNRMHQEREILIKQLKAMETRHQQMTFENLELKAKRQNINYPMKIIDEQRCHQQIAMFAPATPQQHCLQQLVVDPNNVKLVAVSRYGLPNQSDPRVKIHGETYDFMGCSQPLDQSKWLVMDSDLRVRNAAAARKRRMLRIKENKNSLLAMKLSRTCR